MSLEFVGGLLVGYGGMSVLFRLVAIGTVIIWLI